MTISIPKWFRVRSLVVSDLRLETKRSQSSLASSYVQRWATCSNRMACVWVSMKGVEVVERS